MSTNCQQADEVLFHIVGKEELENLVLIGLKEKERQREPIHAKCTCKIGNVHIKKETVYK